MKTSNDIPAILKAYDVEFLVGFNDGATDFYPEPVGLVQMLASSADPRERLALIPLFLRHPEWHGIAHEAALDLAGNPLEILRAYYSAATYLQPEGVTTWLPHDLFEAYAHCSSLDEIEEVFVQRIGRPLNWSGMWEKAACTYLKARRMQNEDAHKPAIDPRFSQ